jgi:uncharacterized protein
MSRIVHFEIPAEKPEQIAEFYKKTLGWDIIKWGGPVDYWLFGAGPEDQPGINGGIARKQDRPSSGILVTAGVASVDETLKRIVESGGSIVVPKQAIPGVGWQAHFRDPEGNVIGLIEYNPEVK